MNKTDVPYIVHESAMSRLDRTIKRLWITVLVLIVLLVGSNACWLYYESQFETVEETTTTTTNQEVAQDAKDGTNNFVGGDVNGKTDDKNENKNG